MSSGIYGIRNIVNGKIYVGQTKDFKHRWYEHVRELNHNIHHNKHLQSAWNKYGEESFEFFIIEKCSPTDLNGYQTFWILYYDSHDNGYNMDIGGEGIRGYKHTKEEIEKMIQIQHPKPVVQLNLDMNYIATFPSASTAGKTLGKNSSSGIKRCCEKDRYKQAYGFRWMYKEDYDSGNIDYDYYLSPNSNTPYRVSKYDLNMKLVEIFENAKEAAKSVNGKASSLEQVIGKRRTYKGFVWRKTDSYTEKEYLRDKEIDYNNLKRNACIENGKIAAKHTKRISQYDFDLNLINIFPSVKKASEAVGDTSGYISQVLNPDRKRSSYRGFVWRKTDEYAKEQYEADVEFYKGYKNPTKSIKVDQCDLSGKVIKTFNSMTKASKTLGIPITGISRCCNGEKENYGGFIWKYHEEK